MTSKPAEDVVVPDKQIDSNNVDNQTIQKNPNSKDDDPGSEGEYRSSRSRSNSSSIRYRSSSAEPIEKHNNNNSQQQNDSTKTSMNNNVKKHVDQKRSKSRSRSPRQRYSDNRRRIDFRNRNRQQFSKFHHRNHNQNNDRFDNHSGFNRNRRFHRQNNYRQRRNYSPSPTDSQHSSPSNDVRKNSDNKQIGNDLKGDNGNNQEKIPTLKPSDIKNSAKQSAKSFLDMLEEKRMMEAFPKTCIVAPEMKKQIPVKIPKFVNTFNTLGSTSLATDVTANNTKSDDQTKRNKTANDSDSDSDDDSKALMNSSREEGEIRSDLEDQNDSVRKNRKKLSKKAKKKKKKKVINDDDDDDESSPVKRSNGKKSAKKSRKKNVKNKNKKNKKRSKKSASSSSSSSSTSSSDSSSDESESRSSSSSSSSSSSHSSSSSTSSSSSSSDSESNSSSSDSESNSNASSSSTSLKRRKKCSKSKNKKKKSKDLKKNKKRTVKQKQSKKIQSKKRKLSKKHEEKSSTVKKSKSKHLNNDDGDDNVDLNKEQSPDLETSENIVENQQDWPAEMLLYTKSEPIIQFSINQKLKNELVDLLPKFESYHRLDECESRSAVSQTTSSTPKENDGNQESIKQQIDSCQPIKLNMNHDYDHYYQYYYDSGFPCINDDNELHLASHFSAYYRMFNSYDYNQEQLTKWASNYGYRLIKTNRFGEMSNNVDCIKQEILDETKKESNNENGDVTGGDDISHIKHENNDDDDEIVAEEKFPSNQIDSKPIEVITTNNISSSISSDYITYPRLYSDNNNIEPSYSPPPSPPPKRPMMTVMETTDWITLPNGIKVGPGTKQIIVHPYNRPIF